MMVSPTSSAPDLLPILPVGRDRQHGHGVHALGHDTQIPTFVTLSVAWRGDHGEDVSREEAAPAEVDDVQIG